MLDPQHSLYMLAEAINWPVFDEQFGPLTLTALVDLLFLLV